MHGTAVDVAGRSSRRAFALAAVMFAGALAGLAWACLVWAQGRAEVQQAIAAAGDSPAAGLAMARLGQAGARATPGLGLAGGLLLLGLVFLARGLWFTPRAEAGSGRAWSAAAVALLLAGGFGLGLVALVDYLRFDDYLSLLLMLS
jgi:hypothetical protein